MSTGYYSFLAIRGHQGGYTYYMTQCPLRLVPHLFVFDEAEVPSVVRQLRSLNPSRVKELVHYLTFQPNDYILAPLIAVVDREVTFEPLINDLQEMGQLQIPLTAQLVIHDGQHRRAAIKQILVENPSLSNDTVPVMLIPDPNLIRSPRLYADLNQEQGRRNLSQRVLQDQNNQLAVLVRQLIKEIPLFQELTELEKTTISNRSTALFTLSAIYQATRALLGVGRRDPVTPQQAVAARQFWQELGQIIPEWQQAIRREVTSAYLRQHYVHSHTVTLLAIGITGHELITTYPDNWLERLSVLGKLDWSRNNTDLWEGRVMVRGRMSKAKESVQLTVNALKQTLGLPLTEKEQTLEKQLIS